MDQIYSTIKRQEKSMLETLRFLVEMESPSTNKQLNDALGESIANLFLDFTGGEVEKIENQQYGNHYRCVWPNSGKNQILILAHFDTVWPEGTIKEKPFHIEGGKVTGPGVFDMKGGIVQGLYALKTLKELQEKIDTRIVFLFTSDEEIGSPTSRAMIEEEAKQSEYVLVLEPAITQQGSIKTSRKGVGIFEMEIEGKPAHSGVDPEKGVSAIEELAHQTLYLHGLTNFENGTTVNVGKITGGTTSNVIAEKAVAEIDLRVEASSEFDRIIPKLTNLKPQLDGTSIQVTGGINRPTLERTEEVSNLFYKLQRIAQGKFGFKLTERSTGGASDGNFTAPFAPTLDGLGAVGDGAHANHEYLILEELSVRSALLAHLIQELALEI